MSGMLFSFIFWSNFVASLECRWISLQGLLEMLESKAMWQLTRQLSQGNSLWIIVPDTGWRWRWRRWADQEDWGEGKNGQARWQGGDKLIVQDELTNPEMHRRQRWQCRRLNAGLNAVQKKHSLRQRKVASRQCQVEERQQIILQHRFASSVLCWARFEF